MYNMSLKILFFYTILSFSIFKGDEMYELCRCAVTVYFQRRFAVNVLHIASIEIETWRFVNNNNNIDKKTAAENFQS